MENSKKSLKDILNDKTGESLLRYPSAAPVISKYANRNDRSQKVNILIADVLKDINIMGSPIALKRTKFFK